MLITVLRQHGVRVYSQQLCTVQYTSTWYPHSQQLLQYSRGVNVVNKNIHRVQIYFLCFVQHLFLIFRNLKVTVCLANKYAGTRTSQFHDDMCRIGKKVLKLLYYAGQGGAHVTTKTKYNMGPNVG